MSRKVLLLHPDEEIRRELSSWLHPVDVTEAATHEEALSALERATPGLVLSWAGDLRRLFRDLDRLAPAVPRAVLCPDAPGARAALSRLVAEGHEFATLEAANREQVRALVLARCSNRLVPASPLSATVRFVDGSTSTLEVAEVGNDGLGLTAAPGFDLHGLFAGSVVEVRLTDERILPVMDPGPWRVRGVRREPGGVSRVGLEASVESQPLDGPAVTDPVRIAGWLQRVAVKRHPVDVTHVDGRLRQRFTALLVDHDTGASTVRGSPAAARWQVGDVVHMGFEIGRLHTACVTSVTEVLADGLRLAAPRLATQHERRRRPRVRIDAEAASITFRSPLDGVRSTRRLIDVEPGGAAFVFDASTDVFPPGLHLCDVELDLSGTRVPCEAVVRACTRIEGTTRRCGLRLHVAPQNRQMVADAFAAWLVPETGSSEEVPFSDVWQLFVDEGARFADHPLTNASTVRELEDAQARLREDGGLGRSFVYRAKGAVLGHAAGLRIYSRTWFSQHLLVRSGFHRKAHVAQALVNQTFDYGAALDDVEYLRGAWDLTNRWTARIYGVVTQRLARSGAACIDRIHVLHRPSTPIQGRLIARETREGGDFLRYVRAHCHGWKIAADDMTEDELFLPSISARYARVGLLRERCLAVVGEDPPRGWAIVEDMSPGLFWREYHTCARFYLVEPNAADAADVLCALVNFAVEHDERRGRSLTRCIASPSQCEALARLGYEDVTGPSLELTAHASMTRQVTAELHSVFERLDLRAALRERRAPERGEGEST